VIFIMSDELIRRYDVLGKAQWIGSPATWDDPWPEGKEAVTVEDIESIPAVDAVEVVRCQECIHRGYVIDKKTYEATGVWCKLLDLEGIEPDFYCKRGKHRE